MICPIATSQMMTSKNPMIGAMYLFPLDMKTTLSVPIDTSQILAQKMRIGRTIQVNAHESKNREGSMVNTLFSCGTASSKNGTVISFLPTRMDRVRSSPGRTGPAQGPIVGQGIVIEVSDRAIRMIDLSKLTPKGIGSPPEWEGIAIPAWTRSGPGMHLYP